MPKFKHITLTLAALLMLPVAASADVTIEITLESGAGLQKLGELCDLLRVEKYKPNMSDDECGQRLLILGARVYDLFIKREAATAAMRAAMAQAESDFNGAMPEPPSGATPTPTPRPTPTATPTPTPVP